MRQAALQLRFFKRVLETKVTTHICSYLFTLTFLVLSSLLPSVAQTQEGVSLTLDKALALSVVSHPLVSAREREYQAAIGEVSAARWSAFPNASFSFRGFRENNDQQALDQEILTVSQPIWTGGKLSGNISAAVAKREAAKFAVIETEQVLIEDTVRAFMELNRAKLKQKIAANDVKEHERLFDIIERRVKASTSPEVDLRLAKARLAFSRSQVLQNTNALEVSKANLEQLVGQAVYDVKTPQRLNLKKSSFSLDIPSHFKSSSRGSSSLKTRIVLFHPSLVAPIVSKISSLGGSSSSPARH